MSTQGGVPDPFTVCGSVVIPAHNEEATIARTLSAVYDGLQIDMLEVVVVCNGCDDRTAELVRANFPECVVVEIAIPSKFEALKAGDEFVHSYPRIYLDADVSIVGASLSALVKDLNESDAQVAAPVRRLNTSGASFLVQAYYAVWESLPQVQSGVFGRGVIAMTREAHDRIAALPHMMSDDLVISEAFGSAEKLIVRTASVEIWTPRTIRDLVRRRVRVTTGNAQASTAGLRRSDSRTSLGTLLGIAKSSPRQLLNLPVFLGVTLAARLLSIKRIKRGDFSAWLRDESSRR